MTLREMGERRLLREIIPAYCSHAGDDCASLSVDRGEVIVTTDPVPPPAARVLGGDSDPYWMGWLLVVINVSDLAAAGALPVGFLSAIEAEPTMPLEDFQRFLAGIRDACRSEGVAYVGGNIREAPALSAVGTAVGTARSGDSLRRGGAKPGDRLISVGGGGIFWRDALRVIRGGGLPEDKMRSPLFAPRTQARTMHKLAEERAIHAAIDNSDGLLPSIQQMASASGVRISVDLTSLSVNGCLDLKVDQARLWLGWGDWNVLAAAEPSRLGDVFKIGDCDSVDIRVIGKVDEGEPSVFLQRGQEEIVAPRLESERFASDSWFGSGIDSYVDRLLSVALPK